MPILSLYVDVSNFTALLYKSSDDFRFFYSSHIYIPDLFSNYTNESEFYKSILELFCSKNGVELEACEVVATGFLNPPKIDLPKYTQVSLAQALQTVKSYKPVIVNDFSVISDDAITSKVSADLLEGSGEFVDFQANKSVYPNLTYTDINFQLNSDHLILKNIKGNTIFNKKPNKPVVFMGSRFSGSQTWDIDYILACSLVNDPGIYTICIDRENATLLVGMLSLVKSGFNAESIETDIENIGTLVTTNDAVEVLLEPVSKPPKMIDVPKNQFMFIPFSEESARLVIKSHKLGTLEKRIEGGKLGVIVDTREDESAIFLNTGQINSLIKSIRDIINVS